ncbi:MAG: pirin family protein [Burkholderiales bacterium]|nr:pirin family protein [Burkholderiales bacterium]
MKKIIHVQRAPRPHWVGNGFRVHSLFFYEQGADALSPFLMLDYGAPHTFAPGDEPRGVGQHPHRGFETVTVAYQGEIEHRDSEGNRGVIGPGDVQWMTAASGIVHEEWLSQGFNAQGGTVEMAQLWVNLPARLKMSAPGYQEITAGQIPQVVTEGGAKVRVIAGEFATGTGEHVRGPARTLSPVNVWDARLPAAAPLPLTLQPGYTTLLAVLHGDVRIGDHPSVVGPALAVLERDGNAVTLVAGAAGATVLILHGEPLNEPVAGHGPFVMNSRDQLIEAIQDFQRGTFIRARAETA